MAGGSRTKRDMRIAILGAGIGGICVAIKLRMAGFDNFTVFDKGNDLGGTWRDNSYPGSGCDIRSFLYCYSFAQKKNWSRAYSYQPEILEYIRECADRFGITPRLKLNTEIAETAFDEGTGKWKVRTADGDVHEYDVVVSALGQLNRPYIPDIPGAADFKGKAFHSARWDHHQDLGGKKIAVIGTGASAIQFVPRIVPQAGHLTLFQRSPNWIRPKLDPILKGWRGWALRNIPGAAWLHRNWIYWNLELRFSAFSPESKLNKFMEGVSMDHLARQIPDPALRATQIPDYPVGCRRVLVSNDYLPSLCASNVTIETSGIKRIAENGIESVDGQFHEVDTIIYGTGFDARNFLTPMKVVGRGGQVLSDLWRNGAEAYLGVTVTGFPGFFMVYGPNTNLGHNSVIFMIERQANYIVKCVKKITRAGLRIFDVTKEAQERFNGELRKQMDGTVWVTNCTSWYKTEDGKVTNNWSGSTLAYWWRMRQPRFSDYEKISHTG